ncbi:MAG TPA: pilus assembly protein TadG-related protein [Solirubrobacteraceae bacterium]|nr:pilus assembly protein TadG-related protein [Solirubrobacteraceae bacterium]
MREGERGQILPGLLVVMLALLAVGVLMFQVGKAAVLRAGAQTAADAAALAGAEEIKRQLMAQWATTGTTQLPVNEALVRARMALYAKKNDATLIQSSVVIQGVDVKAAVTTDEDLGEGAKDIGEEDAEGEAHARARIELTPVLGVGGSIGPGVGGGGVPGGGSGPVPKISDKEWKEIEEKIGKGAPTCDDMVELGRFLQEQGFVVGENAAFGPVGRHDPQGYHFKCGNRGAIDVNFGPPGDLVKPETDAVDPIIAPLRELGFRTIWRASGHYNHLHVDVANSGPIGAGSGGADGGFAGPLEDVLMEVRLIDWDAPTAPFFGFGGVSGGYFGGPPDPKAARAICSVARDLGASDKVLLAAYEAAIVESGVHSLPYGDRDSIGLFQQRDSWGSYAQRMDPEWASRQFISRAIRQDRPWMTPGQLAQDVQVSAFPERYDQRRGQALSLIATYCSG